MWCLDRHTAVSTALALKNPRVSRHWRIRPLSAITREIPPRSLRTYNNCRVSIFPSNAQRPDLAFEVRLFRRLAAIIPVFTSIPTGFLTSVLEQPALIVQLRASILPLRDAYTSRDATESSRPGHSVTRSSVQPMTRTKLSRPIRHAPLVAAEEQHSNQSQPWPVLSVPVTACNANCDIESS